MTILQRYKVKRLRDCRTSLLEIATPDLCYGAMEKWFVQNGGAVDAVHAYNTIIHRLIPYQTTNDADVLEAVRQRSSRYWTTKFHSPMWKNRFAQFSMSSS